MTRIPQDLEFNDYDTRLAAYAVIVDGDRILLSLPDLPRAGIADVALAAWRALT